MRPPPHACLSTTHRNTSAALRRCDCPPGNPVLLGSPTAEDHDLVALHPGRSVGRGKFIDAFDHIGCIVPYPTDVTALRGNDRIPKRELCVPPIDDIAAITLYRPGENGPFVILALWVGRRDVDPRRDSSENLELRVEPIRGYTRPLSLGSPRQLSDPHDGAHDRTIHCASVAAARRQSDGQTRWADRATTPPRCGRGQLG